MKRKESGFSLVELLIAIAIVLIGVSAIVPLYVYITQASESNRMRTVATNLANEVLEDIRSKEFYEVGVVGGHPEGPFLLSEVRTIDGRDYRVQIFINWLEEGSYCLGSGGELVPGQGSWDYKGARVIVAATSVFTGEEMLSATTDTIIARDASQPAQPGANIRTCVFRGWRPDADIYNPVSSVRVDLTLQSGTTSSVWSTSKGSTLFVDRPVGTHTVTVDPASLGMIVEPETSPFTVAAVAASTSTKLVFVEYPCSISVQIVDEGGEAIIGSGRLILETPFKDAADEVVNIINDFTEDQESVLVTGIWPVGTGYSGAYNLKIENVDGYEDYDMSIAGIKPLLAGGDPWDGKFTAPGTEIDITVQLIGLPYIKVQRGELGFASEVTVQTVEIEAVKSLDRAFILLSQRGASGHVSRSYYTAKFVSESQIEIQRGAGGTAGAVVWQVIEASDEVAIPAFEVQTGEATLDSSELSNVIATITDVGEQEQCVVFITTRGTASHNNRHQLLVRGSLNTPTALELYRAASGAPIIVRWWVVKFSDNFQIQKGTIPMNGINAAQDITSIDPSRSAVFMTWDADTNGLAQTSPRIWIDSPTEIIVNRTTDRGSCNINYAVIQFPEGVVVKADNNSGSPSTSGLQLDVTIEEVAPSNSILAASNMCTGTGTAYPRPITTWHLASPDELEFRTNYTGQTNTWSYFVIDTSGWTN